MQEVVESFIHKTRLKVSHNRYLGQVITGPNTERPAEGKTGSAD